MGTDARNAPPRAWGRNDIQPDAGVSITEAPALEMPEYIKTAPKGWKQLREIHDFLINQWGYSNGTSEAKAIREADKIICVAASDILAAHKKDHDKASSSNALTPKST